MCLNQERVTAQVIRAERQTLYNLMLIQLCMKGSLTLSALWVNWELGSGIVLSVTDRNGRLALTVLPQDIQAFPGVAASLADAIRQAGKLQTELARLHHSGEAPGFVKAS